MTKKLKSAALITGLIIWDNILLLGLISFFIYWNFYNGRQNWALSVLIVALGVMVISRWLSHYYQIQLARLIYRGLLITSVALLLSALCIQTVRFVFVFLPGLSEPTLSKILVRVGILTFIVYAYTLTAVFMYYLYIQGLLNFIWHGSAEYLIKSKTQFAVYQRHKWRSLRFSSLLLMGTFFWGGLASCLGLGVGLVAWLLR